MGCNPTGNSDFMFRMSHIILNLPFRDQLQKLSVPSLYMVGKLNHTDLLSHWGNLPKQPLQLSPKNTSSKEKRSRAKSHISGIVVSLQQMKISVMCASKSTVISLVLQYARGAKIFRSVDTPY